MGYKKLHGTDKSHLVIYTHHPFGFSLVKWNFITFRQGFQRGYSLLRHNVNYLAISPIKSNPLFTDLMRERLVSQLSNQTILTMYESVKTSLSGRLFLR